MFLFFWCFFFRIKKCLETDFTVKVNVKKTTFRPFDGHFKFMDKVLTNALQKNLSNAHAFCTGNGVAILG